MPSLSHVIFPVEGKWLETREQKLKLLDLYVEAYEKYLKNQMPRTMEKHIGLAIMRAVLEESGIMVLPMGRHYTIIDKNLDETDYSISRFESLLVFDPQTNGLAVFAFGISGCTVTQNKDLFNSHFPEADLLAKDCSFKLGSNILNKANEILQRPLPIKEDEAYTEDEEHERKYNSNHFYQNFHTLMDVTCESLVHTGLPKTSFEKSRESAAIQISTTNLGLIVDFGWLPLTVEATSHYLKFAFGSTQRPDLGSVKPSIIRGTPGARASYQQLLNAEEAKPEPAEEKEKSPLQALSLMAIPPGDIGVLNKKDDISYHAPYVLI